METKIGVLKGVALSRSNYLFKKNHPLRHRLKILLKRIAQHI